MCLSHFDFDFSLDDHHFFMKTELLNKGSVQTIADSMETIILGLSHVLTKLRDLYRSEGLDRDFYITVVHDDIVGKDYIIYLLTLVGQHSESLL